MTPLDYVLLAIIAACVISLVALVYSLLHERARAERAWAIERTRLLNAALHPSLPVLPPQTASQEFVAEPDEDAAELNLVGQVISIEDGKAQGQS